MTNDSTHPRDNAEEKYYTIPEIVENNMMLGFSHVKLRELVDNGKLMAAIYQEDGKRKSIRIPASSIEKFMREEVKFT
jgi:hypothetical protein